MSQLFPQGTVRIGPISAILDVLKDLGYDPDDVLKAAAVDHEVFTDPDNLLSFKSRAHLMAISQEATGCSDFGLRVGQKNGLSAFGLVGYLAMHSPDVEAALRSLDRYLHLHVHGAGITFERRGSTTFAGYEIYESNLDRTDQLEDGALAIFYNVLQELCGNDWGPTEVWFSHQRPPDTTLFKQFFQVPLRFDMHKSGIYFSSRWLKKSVRAADPELHRLLQKQIDELDFGYQDNFPEQVRRVLHNALLTRHASAEEVAALFSIHSRTLHRRLKSHGTNFQDLADTCRYNIARRMLQTSNASLMQIAEMLDYADPRAFSRAFKRWSGHTPGRWRKAHELEP